MHDGRSIEIQVTDLRAYIVDQNGRLVPEMVQDGLGLITDGTETGGDIAAASHGALQSGIGHRGYDGIGVRVAVTGDIDSIHKHSSFAVNTNHS